MKDSKEQTFLVVELRTSSASEHARDCPAARVPSRKGAFASSASKPLSVSREKFSRNYDDWLHSFQPTGKPN